MSDSIRSVLPIVADGTAAIESAFLSAGQGLSHGLQAFRSLTEAIATLGTELDHGGTASASADLGLMSQTLCAIAARLPADGVVLGDLIEGNKGMARKFDDLVGDMRMMVIVSRSARLEAVNSDEQRNSLEGFSRTIDRQIGDVQRRIDQCACEHAKLTALLERSAGAHLAFDARFRDRLVALVADLDATVASIAHRRAAGLAFMDAASAKARGIVQAAGLALVSLQIGDNTRQRLEHVQHALTCADETGMRDGDDPTAAATVDLLSRLGEAQLRDTVDTFAGEAAQILDAFATLGREAAELVTTGQATYGHATQGGSSFMAEVRARFDAAMDIVGACAANRRVVEGATGALRAMLDGIDGTLTTLSQTSEDLVIVAVNVGLKATRLGSEGRGLVTVAGELKRLAAQIALHAETLLAAFRAVRHGSDQFGAQADGGASSASLDREAAAILDALARGDARIADVLGSLDRTGRDFDATMAGAVRDFEAVVADTVRLTAAADDLRAAAADHDGGAQAEAVEAVDALMLPLYSMAQEREVHAAVVGSPAADRELDEEDWAA